MLKLHPPRPGYTPYWRARGSHFGVKVNRSTQTADKRKASKVLEKWKRDIEQGVYVGPDAPTFASGMISYVNAGHDDRFLDVLLEHFKETPLAHIDQAANDDAAVKLYPDASPATRNRQVYSPVSAILEACQLSHAGQASCWCSRDKANVLAHVEQAFALLREAKKLHARFGALCTFLLHTGCRLNESLKLEWAQVELDRNFAYVGKTKNGEPRAVHLPIFLVAALIDIRTETGKVFRFSKATCITC